MNPLQRAALRRKVYYFAVILVLFTVSMLCRGIIPIPLSDLARAPTNVAQPQRQLAGRPQHPQPVVRARPARTRTRRSLKSPEKARGSC